MISVFCTIKIVKMCPFYASLAWEYVFACCHQLIVQFLRRYRWRYFGCPRCKHVLVLSYWYCFGISCLHQFISPRLFVINSLMYLYLMNVIAKSCYRNWNLYPRNVSTYSALYAVIKKLIYHLLKMLYIIYPREDLIGPKALTNSIKITFLHFHRLLITKLLAWSSYVYRNTYEFWLLIR